MCKATPGARCLPHVEMRLDRARERLLDIEDELAALRYKDADARRTDLSERACALRGKVSRLQDEVAPLRAAAAARAERRAAAKASLQEQEQADHAAEAAQRAAETGSTVSCGSCGGQAAAGKHACGPCADLASLYS